MLSIFEDPRHLQESDAEDFEKADEIIQCPEIEVKIENVQVRGLVDTGSPITCISEEFYLENIKKLNNCPRLPIIGQIIKGALETKSARLKIQIKAETLVGHEKRNIVYLVIPKLVRDCILGIDALREFSFVINLSKDKIVIQSLEGEQHLLYAGGLCKVESSTKRTYDG